MPSKKNDIMLDLLRTNEDVRNEIENIVKNVIRSEQLKGTVEEIENYNLKLSELKELLAQRENDIRKLRARIKEKEQELSECEEKKNNIMMKCKTLEKKYSGIDDIYNKYLSLGSDIHKQLKNVLNPDEMSCESVEMFFGYGIQEGNITALWDSIATNLKFYCDLGKLDDMCFIFEYFLDLYEKITFKSVKKTIPRKGEIYDERCHTRTADSNVTGRIVKVVLPGFLIGKTISKKALVIVK